MATEVINGPYGEQQVASTAGGGTALSTTAARVVLPAGTKAMQLIPRNFSTAVVVEWGKMPWLTILKTQDIGVTFIDYSYAAQDGSTGTSVDLVSQGTLANGDALYIGSHIPFAGVHIDVDAANSNASDLDVNYWNGSAWTAISETDNTDTGAALAIDGTVTWTVPAAWRAERLIRAAVLTNPVITGVETVPTQMTTIDVFNERLYWTRWAYSAALDATTTLDHVLAIPRYMTSELPVGVADEQAVTVGPGGISGIAAVTDAGTANLIVNAITRGADGKF